MEPLYTSANCNSAYELRWSLSLFATTELPQTASWAEQLGELVECDDVRLLEHHFREPNVWQFFLSTKPRVAPPAIVKSVKGRLQHQLRDTHPNAFRRNFSLSSVGEARREVVEDYVANQLGHHRMADPSVQERFAKYQVIGAQVDLAQPNFSSHGRYLYNLHIVLVHDARWCDVREEWLQATHDMVVRVAAKKLHRLSRAGILADHLHLTLGCDFAQSPEEVALAYLNNLAHAHDMKPVFQFGYFVGTFGEYDLGAIRRAL